jgi:hypothetical protein
VFGHRQAIGDRPVYSKCDEPWQTSLNKPPRNGEKKEEREREPKSKSQELLI